MASLVTLRRFRDLPDALLAWSILDSTGIEIFLIDEMTIRMDWLWSNLLGGIKICVKPEDAEEAIQALNLEIPEKFSIEGIGEFEQPHCPQCQALDISFENLNKPVTYACTFLLNLPIQVRRQRWKCQTCGYVWQPTDQAKEKI
jgi:rubredoxin